MENNVFFILKNKDKFSNIKLSKGIILEECQRKELSTQILGASIDARYFYIINNKQALFKSYCSKRYTNIKHNRIINEMLCYYLAQQVGLKCAKYEPATLGDISGLISYNVLEKNEQLCDFFSFSCNLEDFTVSIERIMYYMHNAKDTYNIDEQQIKKDLFKLNIFDMLTMQTDRHVANIHFIYNKDDRSYRVAPIIDNEYAFGGQVLSKIMDHELADYDLIKFVSTTKFMTLKTFYYCSTDDYLKNIQQSVEFAIKNPDKDYLNILKTFIEKINTVQAFKKVEELGYEIDRSYKIFVNKCVKFAKNCIMKEMQNYETKDANDELLY